MSTGQSAEMDVVNEEQRNLLTSAELFRSASSGQNQDLIETAVNRAIRDRKDLIDVETVESTYTVVQEVNWSDDLIDKVPLARSFIEGEQYTIKYKDPVALTWVQIFDAYHAYLLGDNIDQTFYAIWMYCIQHCRDPYSPSLNATTIFGEVVARAQSTFVDLPIKKASVLEKAKTLTGLLVNESTTSNIQSNEKNLESITLNGSEFQKWYSNAENLNEAMNFFHCFGIVAFRAIVKKEETVYKHLQIKLFNSWSNYMEGVRPDKYLAINPTFVKKLSKGLQTQLSLQRASLKFLIYQFKIVKGTHNLPKLNAFHEYAMLLPFNYLGLHSIKLLDKVRDYYRVTHQGLKRMIEDSHIDDVIHQFKNYEEAKKKIGFYIENKSVQIGTVVVNFAFYRYARLFEGRCLLNSGVPRNREIIAFSIGLLSRDDYQAKDMTQLSSKWNDLKPFFKAGRKIRKEKKNLPIPSDEGIESDGEELPFNIDRRPVNTLPDISEMITGARRVSRGRTSSDSSIDSEVPMQSGNESDN